MLAAQAIQVIQDRVGKVDVAAVLCHSLRTVAPITIA
jgi:hypothetical protein